MEGEGGRGKGKVRRAGELEEGIGKGDVERGSVGRRDGERGGLGAFLFMG